MASPISVVVVAPSIATLPLASPVAVIRQRLSPAPAPAPAPVPPMAAMMVQGRRRTSPPLVGSRSVRLLPIASSGLPDLFLVHHHRMGPAAAAASVVLELKARVGGPRDALVTRSLGGQLRVAALLTAPVRAT